MAFTPNHKRVQAMAHGLLFDATEIKIWSQDIMTITTADGVIFGFMSENINDLYGSSDRMPYERVRLPDCTDATATKAIA